MTADEDFPVFPNFQFFGDVLAEVEGQPDVLPLAVAGLVLRALYVDVPVSACGTPAFSQQVEVLPSLHRYVPVIRAPCLSLCDSHVAPVRQVSVNETDETDEEGRGAVEIGDVVPRGQRENVAQFRRLDTMQTVPGFV